MLQESTFDVGLLQGCLAIISIPAQSVNPEVLIPTLHSLWTGWINNTPKEITDKLILSQDIPELAGPRKNDRYAPCLNGNIVYVNAHKTNIGVLGEDLLLIDSLTMKAKDHLSISLTEGLLLNHIKSEGLPKLISDAKMLVTVPTKFGKEFYDFYGLPVPKYSD